MTLGEFREITKDEPDDKELEVFIPYTLVGRGPQQSGKIMKTIEHVATKLLDGAIIITTDATRSKHFVDVSKKQETQDEMFCDD